MQASCALQEFCVPALSVKAGVGMAVAIPGKAVRNLAAFINFGCVPNLEVRAIQSRSGDRRVPKIGFFAKKSASKGAKTPARSPGFGACEGA